MKKYALALLALLLLLPAVLASGEALDVAVPEYVRPYAPAEITVTCPDAGELTLRVSDDYVSYVIATAQAQAGENRIAWDGLGDNAEALQRGAYTLTVTLQTERDTYVSETPLTVKLAAAALQYLIPSGDTVYAGQDGFLVNYLITASGTMNVQLTAGRAADHPAHLEYPADRYAAAHLPLERAGQQSKRARGTLCAYLLRQGQHAGAL